MLYVTGLELTTLTNLLFIIIPQGYLPCAKLSMSFIRPPVLLLLQLPVALIVLQEFIFVHSFKLFIHSLCEWSPLTKKFYRPHRSANGRKQRIGHGERLRMRNRRTDSAAYL